MDCWAGYFGDVGLEDLAYPEGTNVGFTTGHMSDGSMALVARENGIGDINFIHFFPQQNLFYDAKGKESVFTLRYGVFIDKNGKLGYGRFKSPLVLDMFVKGAHTPQEYKFFDEHGLEDIVGYNAYKIAVDKTLSKEFFNKHDIATPDHIIINLENDSSYPQLIQEFIQRTGATEVVLKPSIGARGESVEIIAVDDPDFDEDVEGQVLKLLDMGNDIVVEKREPCRSWFDENGVRLDYNYRALTTYDEDGNPYIDEDMIEVRFGPYNNNPKNKTRDAEVISYPEFLDRMGLYGAEREEHKKKTFAFFLQSTSKLEQEAGDRSGEIGWDAIEKEDEDFTMIELNAGPVGGIGTLEGLHRKNNPEKKGKTLLPFVKYIKTASLAQKKRTKINSDEIKQMPVVVEWGNFRKADFAFALPEKYRMLYMLRIVEEDDYDGFMPQFLGNECLEKESWFEAEYYYRRAYAMEHYSVSLYGCLIETLMIQGKYNAALRYVVEALKLYPEDVDLKYFYAFIESQIGDRSVALERFVQLLEVNPDEPRIYIKIIELLKAEERYADALVYADMALDKITDSEPALFLKGEVLLLMNDVDGATELFTQFLSQFNETYQLLFDKALAFSFQKEYLAAEAAFLVSIRLGNKETVALYNLIADTALRRKDFEKCIMYTKKSLEFDPDLKIAYINLPFLYAQVGNKQDAYLAAKEAFRRFGFQQKFSPLIRFFAENEMESEIKELIAIADAKKTEKRSKLFLDKIRYTFGKRRNSSSPESADLGGIDMRFETFAVENNSESVSSPAMYFPKISKLTFSVRSSRDIDKQSLLERFQL